MTNLPAWSPSLADVLYHYSGYLTRLRTTMSPGLMTADVELVAAPAGGPVSRDFDFVLHVAARPSLGSPDVLLALSVPAVLAWRGRRRSSRLHSDRTDR